MSDEDPIEGGLAIAMTGAASISRAAEVLLRFTQEVKARQAADVREGVAELRKQIDARAELAAAAMVFYGETGHTDWIKKASVTEIVDAVHASHAWAEIDPERFTDKAEAIRDQLAASFGVDLREAYAEKQTADALAAIARDGLKEYDHDLDPFHPSAYDRHVLAQRDVSERRLSTAEVVEAAPLAEAPYDAKASRAARTEAMKAVGAPEAAVTARAVSDQLNGHDPRGTAAAAGGGRGKAPGKAARRAPSRQAGQQRGR